MHELSVVLGILKITEAEFKKSKAFKIESIELEIGTLAGVEIESLNYVWEAAVEGSVLEKAKKEINIILGEGKCVDCDTIFDINNIYDSCPKCNSSFKIILKGKELRVKSISVN
jgi:hydrogenase nickel incorporation protein HypA/HybF